MPNYKIVNTDQLDADLKAVADSIREKSGKSGSLAFPGGFVSAVNGIETGGGGGALETCNVHLLFVTEYEGGNRIHVAYSTIENGKPVSTKLVFGEYEEMIGWVYPEQREYDIEVLCGSNIIVYDDNWTLSSIGGDLSGFSANNTWVMFVPSGTTSASCNISFF